MNLNGFKLEGLGMLVELNMPQAESKHELPQIVVIMDTSSSMGSHVSTALCSALPDAMLARGYDMDAKVEVITFDSWAKTLLLNEKTPTVRSLRNEFFEGSGQTFMHDVFPLLKICLKKYSNVSLFCV